MMARSGGGAKKTAMGQRIIAILPYIKQVRCQLLALSVVSLKGGVSGCGRGRRPRLSFWPELLPCLMSLEDTEILF